jgi:hypothetical protein
MAKEFKLRNFCECGVPIDDHMDKCPNCIIYERPKKPIQQQEVRRL